MCKGFYGDNKYYVVYFEEVFYKFIMFVNDELVFDVVEIVSM